MSLINKMLKEVEKREAKQPGEAKVPFRLQRLGFAKGRTYGVLLWLIWIIVFALLFFVAYQYFYGRGMMQHALVKDVHRRPVAIEASQLAVASTLQQISWSTKAQGENVIRLELNKAPPFTVHKDNRQYVVELQDTNPISQMKLPDVAASTVIQSLQLQQKQNNLAVVIVLKVPAKLQRVMHRSGGHTDLLLVFVPEVASVDQSAHLQSQVEKAPLTPEEKAQQAYQSAIAMAESGQLHSAAKTLGTIVRQWPENSDYRYSLGVVLYQQGQYQPALTLVNQGLKSANDIRLITLKAQLLAKLGQPQQALALMGRYHPDLKEHIGF